MVDKPIQKALESGTDAIEQTSKVLCLWLPDPHTCDCGAYCDAETEFIEEQMLPTDIWKCPECGNRYYRNRE
jgi:hypothetical protein